jgi:hypothetical protein
VYAHPSVIVAPSTKPQQLGLVNDHYGASQNHGLSNVHYATPDSAPFASTSLEHGYSEPRGRAEGEYAERVLPTTDTYIVPGGMADSYMDPAPAPQDDDLYPVVSFQAPPDTYAAVNLMQSQSSAAQRGSDYIMVGENAGEH